MARELALVSELLWEPVSELESPRALDLEPELAWE